MVKSLFSFYFTLLVTSLFCFGALAQGFGVHTQEENLASHPTLPNVVIKTELGNDKTILKTTQYLRIPNPNGQELVELENVSAEEMFKSLGNHEGVKDTFKNTVKSYPKEFGKFNAGLTIVEFVACYGGGMSQGDFKTSSSTPVCVDNIIHALTSVAGNIGFFNFMLANRISSKYLTNLAIATNEVMGRRTTTPQMLRSIRPYVGYVGMAFGSMASDITSQILSIPTFKDCAKDILKGDVNTSNCQQTVTHFISTEFWTEYSTHLPSLIGGAILGGKTHWLLKNSKHVLKTQVLKTATTKGLSEAFKVIKSIKTASNVAAIAGGPTGILIKIGTGVGEVVLFLAWTKVLEVPTTQFVWQLYDNPKIKKHTFHLLDISEKIKNSSADQKASVEIKCMEVLVNPRTRETKTICNEAEHLSEALVALSFHGRRFREKVVLTKFNKSFPEYMQKWETYMSTYLTAKMILEKAYVKRQTEGAGDLPLLQVSKAVTYFWTRSLQQFVPNEIKNKIIPHIEEILALESELEYNYGVSTSSSERKLAEKLVEFKKVVLKNYNYAGGNAYCNYDESRCSALHATSLIPDNATHLYVKKIIPANSHPNYVETRTADFGANTLFLYRLAETLPVNAVIKQLVCNENEDLDSSFLSMLSGRAAKLEIPKLIDNPDQKIKDTCKYYGNLTEAIPQVIVEDDSLDIEVRKIWLSQFSAYLDPLSLLSDSRIVLSSGKTEQDAQAWWNTKILPQSLEFYIDYIKNYNLMVTDHLFSKIDMSAPDQLVKMQKPQPRTRANPLGTSSAKEDINYKISSKYLNVSLLGHMQALTQTLKNLSPIYFAGQNEQLNTALDELLLSFAQHSQKFKYSNSFSFDKIDRTLRQNLQSVLAQPLNVDLDAFTKNVRKVVFSNDNHNMNLRHEALNKKINHLGEILIGINMDSIDPEDLAKYLVLPPKEVENLADADYRKYIAIQIIYHMKLVLDETSGYYDNYLYLKGLFNFSNQ